MSGSFLRRGSSKARKGRTNKKVGTLARLAGIKHKTARKVLEQWDESDERRAEDRDKAAALGLDWKGS